MVAAAADIAVRAIREAGDEEDTTDSGAPHKRVRPHCKQTIPLPLGCTLQINTHRFFFFLPPSVPRAN